MGEGLNKKKWAHLKKLLYLGQNSVLQLIMKMTKEVKPVLKNLGATHKV